MKFEKNLHSPSTGDSQGASLQVSPDLALRGRRCLLVVANEVSDRRLQIASAITQHTGRPVVSGARLWYQTIQAAGNLITAAQLIWPIRVLGALGENGFLCLVPSDRGHLGRGLGVSLAVALLAEREVVVLDPSGELVPLQEVTVIPGHVAGSGAVAQVRWHPGRPPSPYLLLAVVLERADRRPRKKSD